MKWAQIFLIAIFTTFLFSCHGKSSKDYDKNEKNDPSKIDVPSNKDATNPSLADTANSKKDSTIKNSGKEFRVVL